MNVATAHYNTQSCLVGINIKICEFPGIHCILILSSAGLRYEGMIVCFFQMQSSQRG